MPRLWSQTIEAHRREVVEAILDTTAALVAEHGLRAVTMSQVAEEAGIGRATLYKYFPDIESILVAWHDREITSHLGQLASVREQADEPVERLHAVLETYALITHQSRGHRDAALTAFLHRDEQLGGARRQLYEMIHDLVRDGVASGAIRADVAPQELAIYCLHAVGAARALPTQAGVRRLVAVTLAGLRPSP